MSSQGGIYHFDGRLADRHFVGALGKTLEPRGPDGGDDYVNGSLGMCYRAFHTQEQSTEEMQPLKSDCGHVLTWDGRLDNRDDLIAQPGGPGQAPRTDASIVLAAYLKWGTACFSRIIGDWALALWDPQQRVILLARDVAGIRPLNYKMGRESIVWSSELSTFLKVSDAGSKLNDRYLISFLVLYPKPCDTPYRDVCAVPPGCCVRAGEQGVVVNKFWQHESTTQIKYKKDADYEEHFRHLFRLSVSGRLRTRGKVWAELSGGLDSSSIVCMGDEILDERQASQTTKVETVSYLFGESASDDERNYIGYVESKRRQRSHYVNEAEYSAFFPNHENDSEVFLSSPQAAPGRSAFVARLMQAAGARVLLSGQGGDAVMCSTNRPCPILAELLLTGRFRSLHRMLEAFSISSGSTYWDMLWNEAIRPHFVHSATFEGRLSLVGPWLNKALVKELALVSDPLELPFKSASPHLSQRVSCQAICDTVQLFSLQHFRICGPIEATYPYFDRRLLEFMVAIPFDQKLRPGVTRSLHRRALGRILPTEITQRDTKAGALEVICRALRREWSRIVSLLNREARVVRRGYVHLVPLLTTLEALRQGRQTDIFSLIRVISLEAWLRALETELASEEAVYEVAS